MSVALQCQNCMHNNGAAVQMFLDDRQRQPDKLRHQLLSEFDARNYSYDQNEMRLVDEKYVPSAEEIALWYHLQCVELIDRCSMSQLRARVHTRAAISFESCLNHIREISGMKPTAQLPHAFLCFCKVRPAKPVHCPSIRDSCTMSYKDYTSSMCCVSHANVTSVE